MGSDDQPFGPDTEAIRRWMEKRSTYAATPEPGGKHRGESPAPSTIPDSTSAARAVLAALETPSASPSRTDPGPDADNRPGEPGDRADEPGEVDTEQPAASVRRRGPEPTGSPTNRVFKPRAGIRIALSMILLVVAGLAAAASWYAYREQTTTAVGIAVILGVLTLVVWAVRAGAAPTELAVLNGQLEMIRSGRFEAVNLANPYTPVLVEGEPGRRGWKVLIERVDQPLVVIDRTVVDPHEFSEVLYRLRPDLRPADRDSSPGATGTQ